MNRHPFDGRDKRDPDAVFRLIKIISAIDTETFESHFAELCETVQTVGTNHKNCEHAGPMVIIGINLTDDMSAISAVSSPETIEGTPIEPRLQKPTRFQHYDVIGVIQANVHLDSPTLIQGALIEQLSTQWHLLRMLSEMADEFHALSSADETSPINQEKTPFGESNNPFANNDAFPGDFEDRLDDLLNEIERSFGIEDASSPQSDGLRSAFEKYDADELEHLNLTDSGIQCKHCGALYDHETVGEAVLCCPEDDNDGTPIDEQDPDFEL